MKYLMGIIAYWLTYFILIQWVWGFLRLKCLWVSMLGKVKRLLAEKEISEKSHYYPDFFTLEVTEDSFHWHWRNSRISFLLPEWEVFSNSMMNAYKEWVSMGKPYPWNGSEAIYLHPAWSKLPNEQFGKTRLAIELQEDNPNLPAVHIHYKSLRIDLSVEELKEWIELFKDAEKNL